MMFAVRRPNFSQNQLDPNMYDCAGGWLVPPQVFQKSSIPDQYYANDNRHYFQRTK